MKAKRKRPLGLNKSWRIDWDCPENNLAVVLSQHGMTARCISERTGLSEKAVHYRNKKRGVKIRDYRNGVGLIAQQVLVRYTVKTIKHIRMKKVG